ncbi:MAG: hypothetical protein ACRD3D_16545 [Terriglobia bacterium]
MGFPLAPVGVSNVSGPEVRAGGDRNAKRVRAIEPRAAEANDAGGSARADSPAAQNTAPNGGVYQIADAVVFQLQLQNVVFNGDPVPSASPAPNAAPELVVNGDPVPGASPAPDASPRKAASATAPVAVPTAAVSTAAAGSIVSPAGNAVASLQSQEVQLQSALQALGLSPAAIQEFMTVARLLAQLAPSVFQNFVTQVVYLAKSSQAANPPQQPGNTAAAVKGASAIPGSGASTKIEFASVQAAQVEIQAASSQGPGSPTFAIQAEAQAVSLQEFAFSSPAQPAAAPAQNPAPSGSTASPANTLTASA